MASKLMIKLKKMEQFLNDTSPYLEDINNFDKELTLKDIYDKMLEKEDHLRRWTLYFDLRDKLIKQKGKRMMFII